MPSKKEKTLDSLVRALCADYARRRECVEKELIGRRVRMEYVYLNSKILEASAEICGPNLAEIFITEIGEAIGYAASSVDCLGESAYKQYKSEIVRNVAKKLHLRDF
jgi:hypothetical protein